MAEVNATAQEKSLEYLTPFLTDFEKELVRKGRNKAGRGPRKFEAGIYGRATGFETMIGWLFLNDPSRLADLFEQLEEIDEHQ